MSKYSTCSPNSSKASYRRSRAQQVVKQATDVQVGQDGIIFDFVLVMDFNLGLVDHPHVPHVVLLAVQKLLKLHRVNELSHLGLVGALSELSPHGIQHHFGQGAQPRIFLNVVVLQQYPLALVVLANALLALGFIVSHPFGPTTAFLLDLQPCVYVVLEQPFARFRESTRLCRRTESGTPQTRLSAVRVCTRFPSIAAHRPYGCTCTISPRVILAFRLPHSLRTKGRSILLHDGTAARDGTIRGVATLYT